MSTVDTVFLIITASAISLFFILGVIVLGFVLKLIATIKNVVSKAEDAIDSVGNGNIQKYWPKCEWASGCHQSDQ
jgi:hypothetical protein